MQSIQSLQRKTIIIGLPDFAACLAFREAVDLAPLALCVHGGRRERQAADGKQNQRTRLRE